MTSTNSVTKGLGSIAVAGLLLFSAACGNAADSGGGAAASEGEPIVVGVLVDQTGYLKGLDSGHLKGIQAAVEQINEDGGVLGGRGIELVIEDTGADPQQQVQTFQKIVSQEDVTAFLNGTSSAGNAAIAPMAAAEKIPVISSSIVPQDESSYTFSTYIPAHFEAAVRAEYLQSHGLTRIAILEDPSPYSQMVTAAVEETASEYGLEVIAQAEHSADAIDLRPHMSKLLESNPDAVVKTSTGPATIVAAKALNQIGAEVPLVVGVETEANLEQASGSYGKVLFAAAPPMVYDSLSDEQRNEQLVAMHEQFDGEPDLVDIAGGWDSAYMLATALEEAGTTEGTALRDAIESMPAYEGAKTTFDYTATDHAGVQSNTMFLAVYNEDGEIEPVYSMTD